MPDNNDIAGNLRVGGRLTCQYVTLPNDAIVDAWVASDAAIAASKVVHNFAIRHSQNEAAVVADETVGVHVARAAGVLKSVEVVITKTAISGDSTVTVDVKAGNAGTGYATVLSAVATVDNSTALRTPVTPTITTEDYADGDSFIVVIDATVGTGTLPTGLVVTLFFEEPQA